MSSDFDPKWKHGHVTRNGRPARIVCTDRADSVYPMVALVKNQHNSESLHSYTVGGFFESQDDVQSPYDLINAPEPAVKRLIYVFVYQWKGAKTVCTSTSTSIKDIYAMRSSGATILSVAIVEMKDGDGLKVLETMAHAGL